MAHAAAVAGATSGTIVMAPSAADIEKARTGELPFPPDDLISSAKYFAANLPNSDAPPKNLTYPDLVKAGDDAVAQENGRRRRRVLSAGACPQPQRPGRLAEARQCSC